MNSKTVSNIIVIAIIVIIVIGGAIAYTFSQTEPEAPEESAIAAPTLEPPTVEIGDIVIEPPDTLADVAAEVVDESVVYHIDKVGVIEETTDAGIIAEIVILEYGVGNVV